MTTAYFVTRLRNLKPGTGNISLLLQRQPETRKVDEIKACFALYSQVQSLFPRHYSTNILESVFRNIFILLPNVMSENPQLIPRSFFVRLII